MSDKIVSDKAAELFVNEMKKVIKYNFLIDESFYKSLEDDFHQRLSSFQNELSNIIKETEERFISFKIENTPNQLLLNAANNSGFFNYEEKHKKFDWHLLFKQSLPTGTTFHISKKNKVIRFLIGSFGDIVKKDIYLDEKDMTPKNREERYRLKELSKQAGFEVETIIINSNNDNGQAKGLINTLYRIEDDKVEKPVKPIPNTRKKSTVF